MNCAFQIFIHETRDGADYEVMCNDAIYKRGSADCKQNAWRDAALFAEGYVVGTNAAAMEKFKPHRPCECSECEEARSEGRPTQHR